MMFLFPGTLQDSSPDTHSASCYDQPGRCQNVQNDDKMTDPCSGSPCEGGGTCESHDGTFTCYCTKQRSGQYCETELGTGDSGQVLGFTGRSRLSLLRADQKSHSPRYSVSFKVKPLSGEGVLLHSGDTIIALHNGHLQFSHGDNVSSGLVLQSSRPVTLNTWVQVDIQTYHSDVMLVLGDTERVRGRYEEGRLETLAETLHLGALGGGDGVSLPGFTGCLSELVIAGSPVSLQHNIMEARDLVECGQVTASLMVSDQAEAEDLIVFDEEKQVRVRNRLDRRSLIEKKSSLSFELLTEDLEGDLVTVGTVGTSQSQSDHLSLSLSQGRLRARLSLGPDQAEEISQRPVSRTGWVSVSLERSGGRLLVRINRDREIFSLNLGQQRNNKKTSLRSDGFITLGGGLVGQMRNIKIKDRIVKYSDLLLL